MQDFFEFVVPPVDPTKESWNSLPPQVAQRTQGQCDQMLQRLRAGRVSNVELAKISLKYTSRISDLRKRGYVIANEDYDYASGVSYYRLVSEPLVELKA